MEYVTEPISAIVVGIVSKTASFYDPSTGEDALSVIVGEKEDGDTD
jgi:hypothetical protein